MDIKNLDSLPKDDLIQLIKELQQKNRISLDESGDLYLDFGSLLEAASDIISVIDKRGNIIYINSAWKVFFPSWAGRKLGGHYSKNIPAIEKERASFVFDEVINRGKTIENELMKTYNEKGQKIYLTASFSPIKSDSGEIIGLIGIMKNITEKHLAEKKAKEYSHILEIKVKEQLAQAHELKELRDFNEDIINHAPIGIFVMDPSGIILSLNPALEYIMGHKPSESMVGVNLLKEPGFTESELGRLYERCIISRKTEREFNIPYRAIVSGRDLILNATVVPIIDSNGLIEKTIVMVEDHTEQATITNRVYEAEKLSALGILASGVASELKACINKMVMDINFVDNNLEEGSPVAAYIDSLHHEVARIKNITEQLVSLSAADDTEKETCNLDRVLASRPVDAMLKRLMSEGYEVHIEPSGENPEVRANQNQLQQILIQFIENAEEAMPEKGSITIAVKTRQTSTGKYAIMTIEDSGIGIPEENLQKIFQPFFTTKGKEATGLGLMITSAIVQNLGGSIGVKSKPGEGTSFQVILPLVDKSS